MERYGSLLFRFKNEEHKEQASLMFEIACQSFDVFCKNEKDWFEQFLTVAGFFGEQVKKISEDAVTKFPDFYRYFYEHNPIIDNVVWEGDYVVVNLLNNSIDEWIQLHVPLLQLMGADDIRAVSGCEYGCAFQRLIDNKMVTKIFNFEEDSEDDFELKNQWFHDDLHGVEPLAYHYL